MPWGEHPTAELAIGALQLAGLVDGEGLTTIRIRERRAVHQPGVWQQSPAAGIRALMGSVGDCFDHELPQQILWRWLDDFVLVSDDEIRAAQALMIEATRNLVEAAGAAPSAAGLRLRERLTGKRVALILSGGNASREQLLEVLGASKR